MRIWDGQGASAQQGGVDTGYDVEVDASGRYTAGETDGKNAVVINKSAWNAGVVTFTKSVGTGDSREVRLTKANPTWSGNIATVRIWDGQGASAQQGGVDTGYDVEVDASARYTQGKKDATLSGSWASPGKVTVSNASNADRYWTSSLADIAASDITWSGSTASFTVYAYNNGSETKTSTNKTLSVSAEDKLETKSVTANGTYTPSSGKIGFSKVTVSVPTGYTNIGSRFGHSSSGYYIEAYNKTDNTSISNSSTTYKLGLSGTTVQVQNSSGTQINDTATYSIPLETKSITSNGTYTPSSGKVGLSSVTVNVSCGHTFDNDRTFTSNGTYYSSTYGYSGFSKVIVNVNTATETKSITSNGTYTPSSGKIGFSSVTVDVPVPSVTATSWTNTADDYWRADLTIGGVTRSSTAKDFSGIRTAGYNSGITDGWSGCYATVGLNSTTTTTLYYSDEITVKAQAKASSGASGKTDVATRVIKAKGLPGKGLVYYNGSLTGITVDVVGSDTADTYIYPTLFDPDTKQQISETVSQVWKISKRNTTHSIDVNSQQIYRDGSGTAPWGSAGVTTLSTLSTLVKNNKNQQVYFVFRVTCGDTNKWYRFTSM